MYSAEPPWLLISSTDGNLWCVTINDPDGDSVCELIAPSKEGAAEMAANLLAHLNRIFH
jgi:hypothetical protein